MTYQENRNKGGRPKTVKGKPSHFLRELLLHGKVVAARTQEDRRQIRMLEGGCNNLNQLAKMAHQQGFSLLKGKIMDLLDEFNKIIGKI